MNLRRALLLVALAGLGVVFWSSPVLYPIKLLVVMIHETGHAVSTWLVGGEVRRITIASNQSGMCLSALPSGFLPKVVVYSAGYVGSAIASASMLWFAFRVRRPRWLFIGLAGWLALMGVVYAGSAFTLVFCLAGAAGFFLAARYLPDDVIEWMTLFLATFSCLYVVHDLWSDLWDGRVRAVSDAALLAQLTYVPSVLWAGAWTLISLTTLSAALKLTLSRSSKRAPEPLSATRSARGGRTAGPGSSDRRHAR